GRHPRPRRHRLPDRPVRRGQVHDRRCPGGPAGGRGPAGHGPRRRRRPYPSVQRARLLQGAPRPQHPADRLGRRRGGQARRHGGRRRHRALRGRPRGGPRAGRAARPVRPRPPGHPARGLRAARRQGALRQSPGWRDPRVHRDQRPLRAAAARGGRRRHVRDAAGGGGRPDPLRHRPDRL
ncbi:MAG: Adenylylsulfate kinase, partial [uncultured Blastococcus sp.]